MIKTMLLTAQLALSPIVGTNGLQPKRLPNPVYGETTDYSVTYNGETYTRRGYNEKEQYTIDVLGNQLTNFKLGVDDSLNKWVSNNLGWTSYTNIEEQEPEEYITFEAVTGGYQATTSNFHPNTCFSYWYRVNATSTYYYNEFYFTQNSVKRLIYGWDSNGTYTTYLTQENLANFTLYANFDLYFYEPNWARDLQFPNQHPRTIPIEQPTIPNPSVYDNIYNFYYQNLFANEALEELNAEVGNNSLTMRQWLAHTATIISISLLAVALAVLVIKIFKLIAGSLSDIWG